MILDTDAEFIIGSDEVGYGCLAGPIVVGAVRAPKDWNLEGLNDSKKLSEKKRNIMNQKLMDLWKAGEISYALAEMSAIDIDILGLAKAQKQCYIEAITDVWHTNSLVIVDGTLKLPSNQIDLSKVKSIIKADNLIPTVMAASIIAKVYRDGKMRNYHADYPQYNFASNVGYGSKEHMAALQAHGPCAIHRHSYKPIKAILDKVSIT